MSLDYNESNKIHKKSIAIKTLYLIDDNFNTFEHVIDCLVKICEHHYLQAEQCAYIVHHSGKCSVKTGSLDELIPKCKALLEEGLSAEVV